MKPTESKQRAKPKSSRKRVIDALSLSLVVHAGLGISVVADEIWEQRANIVYAAQEQIKAALESRPIEKGEYEEELKEALEKGEQVDLGEFYLKTQYLSGRLTEEGLEKALDELSSEEDEVRANMKGREKLLVLEDITSRRGGPASGHSYLSSILFDEKGNCKARERFTSALVDRIYPDMEMMYQKVRINGRMHTRTLVKVDGVWYAMESSIVPLEQSSLLGTVLHKKYDKVRHYLGKKVEGEYKRPTLKISSKTRITIGDDYQRLPLPDGISVDNIRDIASTDPRATGVPAGGGMTGMIGSPITAEAEGGQGWSAPVYYSGPERFSAMDVEIISVKEAIELEKVSDKWKEHLKLSEPRSEELPDLNISGYPPRPKENPSWADFVSQYFYSAINNTTERIPSHSGIVEHSLFQNYQLWERWLPDGPEGYFLPKICKSRQIQEILYQWASPALKNVFAALDMEIRKKHLATLKHLREYLKTYDHEKELRYKARTEKEGERSAFVQYTPGEYYAKYKTIPPDGDWYGAGDWTVDYSTFSKEKKLGRENRYAEAFIFRKIEMGMNIEDAQHWVDQGIADMEELMDEPQVTFDAE